MSALNAATVLAALHEQLDGQPYLQTFNGSRVSIEVYECDHGLRLANRMDGLTSGHSTGARILTVWVGTVRGVPVEVIHMDVKGMAA